MYRLTPTAEEIRIVSELRALGGFECESGILCNESRLFQSQQELRTPRACAARVY
jgi:hypothetical protein